MVPEVEKPRVTEIKVRMDCNGCVQKVRKALQGITGIYDICIDFPEQKITIIGWVDPVKIVKAIKKTKKSAMICSHTEQSDRPAEQTPEGEPEGGTPEGGAPPPESNNVPTEQPQAEAGPPADGQKEPPPPEFPPPKEGPMPESANEAGNQPIQHVKPKDLEEIHVIYHHPPDYGSRYAYGHHQQPGSGAQWNAYPSGPGIRAESPQPVQSMYATHNYNTYRPSPYITEYAHPQSAPGYSHYSRPDNHGRGHYSRSDNYGQGHYSGSSNGSITSMFSEENPNACCIV